MATLTSTHHCELFGRHIDAPEVRSKHAFVSSWLSPGRRPLKVLAAAEGRVYKHERLISNMRAPMRVVIVLGSLIALAPTLFGAGQGPAAQAPAGCAPTGNIRYVCGQEAPEDLVAVPGSDWVIASVFAGKGGIRLINSRDKTTTVGYPAAGAKERLDAKTYDSCPGAPDAAEKENFRTHGLAIRAGRNSVHTLYAVHHGPRESVEVFEVD